MLSACLLATGLIFFSLLGCRVGRGARRLLTGTRAAFTAWAPRVTTGLLTRLTSAWLTITRSTTALALLTLALLALALLTLALAVLALLPLITLPILTRLRFARLPFCTRLPAARRAAGRRSALCIAPLGLATLTAGAAFFAARLAVGIAALRLFLG